MVTALPLDIRGCAGFSAIAKAREGRRAERTAGTRASEEGAATQDKAEKTSRR